MSCRWDNWNARFIFLLKFCVFLLSSIYAYAICTLYSVHRGRWYFLFLLRKGTNLMCDLCNRKSRKNTIQNCAFLRFRLSKHKRNVCSIINTSNLVSIIFTNFRVLQSFLFLFFFFIEYDKLFHYLPRKILCRMWRERKKH